MKNIFALATMSLLLLTSLSLAKADHTVHGQNHNNQPTMQNNGVMTNSGLHDNMPANAMNINEERLNHTSMGNDGTKGNAGNSGMGGSSGSGGMGDGSGSGGMGGGSGSGGMGGGSGSGGMGGGSGSGGSGSGSSGGMGRH